MKLLARLLAFAVLLALDPGRADAEVTLPPGPYHVAVEGGSEGPFTADEIAEAVTAGRINAHSRLWSDALGGWRTAGTLGALSPLFSGAPPVPTERQPPPVPRRPQPQQERTLAELLEGRWKSDTFTDVVEGVGLLNMQIEISLWRNGDALMTVNYLGAPARQPFDRQTINGNYRIRPLDGDRIRIEIDGTSTGTANDRVTKRDAVYREIEWRLASDTVAIQDTGQIFRRQGPTQGTKPPAEDPAMPIEPTLPNAKYIFTDNNVEVQGPDGQPMPDGARAAVQATIQFAPGDRVWQQIVTLETRGRRNEVFVGTYEIRDHQDKTFTLFVNGETTSQIVVLPDPKEAPQPTPNAPPQFPQHSTTRGEWHQVMTVEIIDDRRVKVDDTVYQRVF